VSRSRKSAGNIAPRGRTGTDWKPDQGDTQQTAVQTRKGTPVPGSRGMLGRLGAAGTVAEVEVVLVLVVAERSSSGAAGDSRDVTLHPRVKGGKRCEGHVKRAEYEREQSKVCVLE